MICKFRALLEFVLIADILSAEMLKIICVDVIIVYLFITKVDKQTDRQTD